MKLDRIFSVLALVIATAALLLSLGIGRPNPLGSDLSRYDMSNPEAALSAVRRMVAKEDLRAGLQYLKRITLKEDDPQINFFFDDVTDVNLVKTFTISGSGWEENNGRIISFVKYKIRGVDYRHVFAFRKTDEGTFYLDDPYIRPIPYEEKNEADQRYELMIKRFRETGAID